MTEKCLDIISRITVEIHKDGDTKQKLGSGRRTVVTGPCLAVAGGGKPSCLMRLNELRRNNGTMD